MLTFTVRIQLSTDKSALFKVEFLVSISMPYEHDVFISYRRYAEWPKWVKEVFYPVFCHWLGEELPNVTVFIDYEIETGTSWPQKLGQALGRSRVLVPLFSRQYFSSPWCQLELGYMLAREAKCGFRTAANAAGLVVPAYIHDGNAFPQHVFGIQGAQLQQYTNPWLSQRSLTEELLSEAVRAWVPDIAAAVNASPPHDDSWTGMAVSNFVQEFANSEPRQDSPPTLG
jgi:hypothetical protein